MLPAVGEQWLRALPKNKRKLLAPMPEKVQALTQRLLRSDTYRQGRLLSVLASLLRDLYRVQVAAEDWDQERLPEHLRLFCKVIDDRGKVLASGRNLQTLKEQLKGQASDARADFSEYQKTNIRALPDSLPDHVVLQTSAGPTMGFPGLRYAPISNAPHVNSKTQAPKQVDLAGVCNGQRTRCGESVWFCSAGADKTRQAGTVLSARVGQAQTTGFVFRVHG
jgi:hypothetical protein